MEALGETGMKGSSGKRRLRPTPRILLLVMMAAFIARAAAPAVPIITTYAGTGSNGDWPGDGGPATQAPLYLPGDLEFDSAGNLYITTGYHVRKITPAGVISTVAGNGTDTYAGDGVLATQTGMDVTGIALDRSGNLYIGDGQGNRIRKVSTAGIITTIAGSGPFVGFSGDGGPALQATLHYPSALLIDRTGNLLFSDLFNNRIRKISTSGIITTVVGNGSTESSGDGGPATAAGLATAGAMAMDAAGNLYIADGGRIRKVNAAGIITAYAGGGTFQYDPVAENVRFNRPGGLALDAGGNLYVTDSQTVRMISPQRIMRRVAGDYGSDGLLGRRGYAGDGGPADQSLLNFPTDVAIDAAGNQYVSDQSNFRVRKITPQPAVAVPSGLDAFKPYRSMPLPGWPADIVVGDVNGDRRSDVITSTTADPSQADPANDFKLRVHLQRADGTLAPPISLGFPAGTANVGGSLALADFNRDGILDVAVGHGTGVSVMAGSRTSSFVLKPFYTGTATPADEAMAVGDMDRDGNVDVVSVHTNLVNSTYDPLVTIAYGNGLGTSSRQRSSPIQWATSRRIAVAEINGDGWLDVVDANNWSIDFLRNDAHGALLAPQIAAQESTVGLSVGDVNGDNRSDVVASVLYGAADMVILPQGSSGPPVHRRSYTSGGRTAVADVDGDRRADVLVAHDTGAVSVLMQTANGLQEGIKYPLPLNDVSASSGPLATGDVNGDGCLDVVLPLLGVGLAILEGQHCRISVNGTNPRIPRRPAAVVRIGAPEALAQASATPVAATDGRLVRFRNLIGHVSPLPRVMAWLAAQYASMKHESTIPIDAAQGRHLSAQQPAQAMVPLARPLRGLTRNAFFSPSAVVGPRRGTVCAR